MKTVKLKGLNKRGKTRINNFSDDGTFKFIKEAEQVASLSPNKGDFILVESFKHNFRLSVDHIIPWGGWFEVGVDVEILKDSQRKGK